MLVKVGSRVLLKNGCIVDIKNTILDGENLFNIKVKLIGREIESGEVYTFILEDILEVIEF